MIDGEVVVLNKEIVAAKCAGAVHCRRSLQS